MLEKVPKPQRGGTEKEDGSFEGRHCLCLASDPAAPCTANVLTIDHDYYYTINTQ